MSIAQSIGFHCPSPQPDFWHEDGSSQSEIAKQKIYELNLEKDHPFVKYREDGCQWGMAWQEERVTGKRGLRD